MSTRFKIEIAFAGFWVLVTAWRWWKRYGDSSRDIPDPNDPGYSRSDEWEGPGSVLGLDSDSDSSSDSSDSGGGHSDGGGSRGDW